MAMAKLSGGGITSNKLVREGVRSGPPNTNIISPRGVSQYGYATGGMMKGSGSFTGRNSALDVNEGTASQPRSGNDVAASTVAGPGGSRTVYRAGSQSATPAVQMPQGGKDILSEFGREPTDPGPLVDRRS
jgi:hypothetical protein